MRSLIIMHEPISYWVNFCWGLLSFPDAAVVDPTLDPSPALPSAVNAPHVANEAVIVTVTPGKKGNGSEHAHPHDHAQHHPHDQRRGHAPAHQQQSSVIKKRNRVVDKVGQPAPTELYNTEKLYLQYCQLEPARKVHVKQTYFKKEKIRHFTYTNASELESFRLVKCYVVKYCVSELFFRE